MQGARQESRATPDQLAAELRSIGESRGLAGLGFATAERFERARAELESRKERGLHGEMSFTYGNPARSTDVTVSLPSARALVVGALDYSGTPPGPAPQQGARVARFAAGHHYAQLRDALDAVAQRLRRDGHDALVLVDDNRLVDREAAYQAGLGWYGRNTNLLIKGKGSYFVLGSVATSAPLPTSATPVADGCGTCTRCIPACPTGALDGVELDARRCLTWLLQSTGDFPREHRVALGDRIYGCDACQEACPPSFRHERHATVSPDDAASHHVDLIDLLDATDDEVLDRHGAWYIPRRQPAYVRRNALVVLGNVGDGADVRVARVLRRALADENPMLRSHAAWACRRLGRDDLLDAVRADPDPAVQAELVADTPLRSPG